MSATNGNTEPETMGGTAEMLADGADIDDGMLEYEVQLFLDIVQRDGIVIAAKGVSLLRVITNILRVYADPGNLVLVVNCSEQEERRLTGSLRASRRLEHSLLHTTTYSSGASDDRSELYLSGGLHFVTTRILVVDLLKKRVPVAKVTGIVVLNAHRVLESGQEAFIMRLYRQDNKTGFVKAFSNDAQSFTYGFGQLERIMRNLFVREVHIWPRFHSSVIASLKNRASPDLIELHIPITPAMNRIQTCLLELINTLIREIKTANKTIELAELTVENALLPKFMRLLQMQVDVIWERLSSSSRRLVSELCALHQLLVRHLFLCDAVAFHAHLQQYRSREYGANATWVYYREADQLFTSSRGRVLSAATNEFDPEYSPKWKTLLDILNREIPVNIAATMAANKSPSAAAVVLILCQERVTCHQLNQLLRYGPRHYLLSQALHNRVKFDTLSDAFKACKASLLTDVVAAATSCSVVVSDRAGHRKRKKDDYHHRTDEHQLHEDGKERTEKGDEEELRNVYHLTMNESTAATTASANESVHGDSQFVFQPTPQHQEGVGAKSAARSTLSVVIRTFREAVCCGEGGAATATLAETLDALMPSYVVLYQANVTAIRQLEIYEAKKTDTDDAPTKIFFLVHAGTVEEQSYLTSLRREKQAFEHLIEIKSRMVVPEDQDGRSSTNSSDICPVQEATADGYRWSSRAGGTNNTTTTTTSTIVVDMREFRSELPALLHRRGIRICPLTITVGDYILTPAICVERKSLTDLVGSLQSGRLYAQCTQMQRAYARPMLLIEFDQNKPFSWDSSMQYLISTDEQQKQCESGGSFDVQRRLVLLTMHFPQLRIIWSPNPYATVTLFQELKEGKEEPNPEHIQQLNNQDDQQQQVDDGGARESADRHNVTLSTVLPRLSGVTSRTATQLMNTYCDLADLCGATELQLRVMLGAYDARTLYTTLHGDTMAKATTDAGGGRGRGTKDNKFQYISKRKSTVL